MAHSHFDITLETLRKSYPQNKADSQTCEHILDLLHTGKWGSSQYDTLAQLARKLDITKRLDSHYKDNWGPAPDAQPLSDPWVSLFTTVLYKAYLFDQERGFEMGWLLKRMNTLFKGLDKSQESWLARGTGLRKDIEEAFQTLRRTAATASPQAVDTKDFTACKELKTIPLTVLFSEGPIARAYLETIKSLGLKPQKILRLVSSRDLATKKKVGRFLPKAFRTRYASNLQFSRMNYWPQKLSKDVPALKTAITEQVRDTFHFATTHLKAAMEPRPLSEYSDEIETLMVENLRDPALLKTFENLPSTTFLFTGGGIVPKGLLEIPGIRLLHIHPGFLPDIRGGDCALWSMLLAGQTSATCFYMDPGIDTGDIIQPSWLPEAHFDFDPDTCDLKTLYRAIFSFFDPWVRSYVLRQVLDQYDEFDNLNAIPQKEKDGITYHFMHPRMQLSAIKCLFKPQQEEFKKAA